MDAAAFLEALSKANGDAGTAEVKALFEWVRKDLYAWPPAMGPSRGPRGVTLSGLSIFAPRTPREATKYAALELAKESKLGDLWTRHAEAVRVARERQPTPGTPRPGQPKQPPKREPTPY